MVSIISLPDKRRCLDILTSAFATTPGLKWMFGKSSPAAQMRLFFRYCLSFVAAKNGAFISTDRCAVVLLHDLSCPRQSVKSRLYAAILFLHVLGPFASLRVMRFRKLVAARRPKKGLYAWFIASDRKASSIQGMYELQRSLFKLSDELMLPIYAEATSARNMILYTLCGFQVYDQMHHPYGDFTVYFLKRDPNGKN